jgi:hypothetical protein
VAKACKICKSPILGSRVCQKPLVLDRALIGLGIGPPVDGADNMEKEMFKLETFVTNNWDL